MLSLSLLFAGIVIDEEAAALMYLHINLVTTPGDCIQIVCPFLALVIVLYYFLFTAEGHSEFGFHVVMTEQKRKSLVGLLASLF